MCGVTHLSRISWYKSHQRIRLNELLGVFFKFHRSTKYYRSKFFFRVHNAETGFWPNRANIDLFAKSKSCSILENPLSLLHCKMRPDVPHERVIQSCSRHFRLRFEFPSALCLLSSGFWTIFGPSFSPGRPLRELSWLIEVSIEKVLRLW